jgi:hypothetical protein
VGQRQRGVACGRECVVHARRSPLLPRDPGPVGERPAGRLALEQPFLTQADQDGHDGRVGELARRAQHIVDLSRRDRPGRAPHHIEHLVLQLTAPEPFHDVQGTPWPRRRSRKALLDVLTN